MKLPYKNLADIFDSIDKSSYNWVQQFARAVIAANNAKVLDDLKPVSRATMMDWYSYFTWGTKRPECSVNFDQPVYSSDQVSALIQERDALAARVKELERERDDYERRWQAERRIVESSISGGRYPDGYPAY